MSHSQTSRAIDLILGCSQMQASIPCLIKDIQGRISRTRICDGIHGDVELMLESLYQLLSHSTSCAGIDYDFIVSEVCLPVIDVLEPLSSTKLVVCKILVISMKFVASHYRNEIIQRFIDVLISTGARRHDNRTCSISPSVAVEALNQILRHYNSSATGIICVKQKDEIFDIMCDNFLQIQEKCSIFDVCTTLTMLLQNLVAEKGDICIKLHSLFNVIITISQTDNKDLTYTMLCSLADFFIPASSSSSCGSVMDLRKNSAFWVIVQDGLCSDVSLTRKRSMYLLKRAVDLTVIVDEANTPSAVDSELFWWSADVSKELVAVWQDYILLMETLEEKQVHVIKPVMGKLENLLRASDRKLSGCSVIHPSWISIVLRRAFGHESLQIQRWGVECCLSPLVASSLSFGKHWHQFICGPHLKMFNETGLFGRDVENASGSYPKVAESLKSFLEDCLQKLPDTVKDTFFCDLAASLCDIAWAEVPLFYMCRALSLLTPSPLWDTDTIQKLREFLASGGLAFFDIRIRSAIQCLMCEAVLNLSDTSVVSFESFAWFVSCLQTCESLKRGTMLWEKCCDWLKLKCGQNGTWDVNDVVEFVETCLASVMKRTSGDNSEKLICDSPDMFTKILILLCDSGIISLATKADDQHAVSFESLLGPVLDIINTVNHRAYMAVGKAENCLKIITCLIEELGLPSFKQVDEIKRTLMRLCAGCIKEAMYFVLRKITSEIKQITDLDDLDLCCDVVTQFSKVCLEDTLKSCAEDILPNLVTILSSYNTIDESQSNNMTRLAALRAVATICDLPSHPQYLMDMLLKFLVKADVTNVIKKDANLSQNDWGRVVDLYLHAQWRGVLYVLHHHARMEGFSPEAIVHQALETLSVSSQACTPVVFKCLQQLLQMISTKEDLVCQVLDVAWNKTLETTTNLCFWSALQGFVSLTFQPELLRADSCPQGVFDKVHEFALVLMSFGEEKVGVANVLIQHLCEFWLTDNNVQYTTGYMDIIMQACLMGTPKKGIGRMEKDVLSCIHNMGNGLATNQIFGSTSAKEFCGVRATVASLLALNANNQSMYLPSFQATFLDLLIQKHLELMKEKSYRNFPNSALHRTKHRIVTAILILEPTVNEFTVDTFISYVLESLQIEQQMAIRYYLEWLAMRILYRFPHTRSLLWEHLKQQQDKKISCICSMMSVAGHVGQLITEPEMQEEFIECALPLVLPWCMAHHFNTRVFAQVTLHKLWSIAEENNLPVVKSSALAKACVDYNMSSGKNAASTQKLLEHFFFFKFHPLRDFSMETVFHTLPRLLQLAEDEWFPVDVMKDVDSTWNVENRHHIQLVNGSLELAKCQPGVWKVNTEREESAVGPDGDFQKKIMPWRSMLPDVEVAGQTSFESKKKTGELVVVTSLIDKAPNLGGLCRTSEIFNVAEFVVGSLKVLDDRTFQSLSVTAQKWLPIKEVHAHKLKVYLQEMKDNGYTLVGVEQTANSKDLTQFRFPVKTLLLLGKEKSGIPVDLIQMLDVCVEIPQLGVIRSLNVHVSGALLIWEYTRQQLQS